MKKWIKKTIKYVAQGILALFIWLLIFAFATIGYIILSMFNIGYD